MTSPDVLRYAADATLSKAGIPSPLTQMVKILFFAAGTQGLIPDPDAALTGIAAELEAFQGELDHDRAFEAKVTAMHLREAAQGLDRREAAQAKAEARTDRMIAQIEERAIGQGFDPRGWFVYLLWSADDQQPLYVGMSGNVLARLGTHLSSPDRRHLVRRVSLIACGTRARALSVEGRLIAKHRPPLNVLGVA